MLPWQHFCQGALGQKIQFFVKNAIFLLQNVFTSDFLALIRNQQLRIGPCAKFQLNWTKDEGTRILYWSDTKNDLMTSYLPPSDDVSKIFMAFERFCTRVPSCAQCAPPAYMIPKDPSLNRVKPNAK